MWSSNMFAPGHIQFDGVGDVEAQSLEPSGKSATETIVKVLDAAGLNARYSSNVMYAIWRKACVNGVMNLPGALVETNNIGFDQASTADVLTRKIVQEFGDVAQFEGVNLDREEVIQHVEGSWTTDHFASMYQDLITNHRLTEIDYINGAAWQKGRQHDVPTPYCACITQLIHTKEQFLGILPTQKIKACRENRTIFD